MTSRDTLKHHARLLDGMADIAGVDLQEAAIAAGLTPDEISTAVLRCTECSDPEHCATWQASQTGQAQPPTYCRNGNFLERLKL